MNSETNITVTHNGEVALTHLACTLLPVTSLVSGIIELQKSVPLGPENEAFARSRV